MSGCIDPKYEEMLHAFELGMLSEEDRDRLQIHLLECDHCFSKAGELRETAALLRDDPEVVNTIDFLAKKKQQSNRAGFKIMNIFWPKKPKFVFAKPLSVLILILIISYPVYRFGFYKSSQNTQTLNLFPLRGNGQDMISLEKGGEVIINFVDESATAGKIFDIIVSKRTGEIIFSKENYSEFNTNGMGTIVIPADKFKKGDYALKIDDPASKASGSGVVYYFKAE